MLAETSTTEISKRKKPKNFKENREVAKRGGGIARNARVELEKEVRERIVG